MRPRTTPARRAAAALLPLALGAALLATPSQAAPAPDPGPRWTVHSSDGVRGTLVRRDARSARTGPRTRTVTADEQRDVVPGLTFRRWSWTDPRGPVRAQLLTLDLAQPGLALEYVAAPRVPGRAPLSRLLAREGAVAGVNGDFFDIADTGAPLGVGRDPRAGLRGAPAAGWTRSFWMRWNGTPRVGDQHLVARVARHPSIEVTGLNQPTVPPGEVGVYTPAWGRTVGARVTDGQRRRVREVVVVGRRVRSNRPRLSVDRPVRGVVLVGRGAGARALAALRPGTRARVHHRLAAPARVAIGGSVVLLRDSVVTAVDDVEMHPRTAIGIDEDTGLLLLLVVDGRQEGSRGLTMVELARELQLLGAEQALNLDGGGSSTMVAPRASGVVGVVNRPSDGRQRAVPNGLGITWTPPAAR